MNRLSNTKVARILPLLIQCGFDILETITLDFLLFFGFGRVPFQNLGCYPGVDFLVKGVRLEGFQCLGDPRVCNGLDAWRNGGN